MHYISDDEYDQEHLWAERAEVKAREYIHLAGLAAIEAYNAQHEADKPGLPAHVRRYRQAAARTARVMAFKAAGVASRITLIARDCYSEARYLELRNMEDGGEALGGAVFASGRAGSEYWDIGNDYV